MSRRASPDLDDAYARSVQTGLTNNRHDMETSFALTGKDYVIVAADTTAARSIVKMKDDLDKIKELSTHLLMAYSGEPGLHRVHVLVRSSSFLVR